MANNGSNDAFRDARHAEDNISEFKGEQEDARKADDGNEAHSVTGSPRDLISRVLDFLSNASNETLGACLVALGAATWVVLGRVGLVLMGIIGGIVLHATWETSTQGSADAEAHNKESRKRREKGLEIVARVLDWRDRLKDGITLKRAEEVSDKGSDFIGFQPETGVAMLGLTDAIIRDYVKCVIAEKSDKLSIANTRQMVVFTSSSTRVFVSIRLPANIDWIFPLGLLSPLSQTARRHIFRLPYEFVFNRHRIFE